MSVSVEFEFDCDDIVKMPTGAVGVVRLRIDEREGIHTFQVERRNGERQLYNAHELTLGTKEDLRFPWGDYTKGKP